MKWFVLWNDVPGMYSKYSSSGFSGFSPYNPTYWFTTKMFSNVIRVYMLESCFDAAVKVLINPKIFIWQNNRRMLIIFSYRDILENEMKWDKGWFNYLFVFSVKRCSHKKPFCISLTKMENLVWHVFYSKWFRIMMGQSIY